MENKNDVQGHTSEVIKSAEPKTNGSTVNTDQVGAFVKEIIQKAINTYSDQQTAIQLVLAGSVSWVIAYAPVLAFWIFLPLVPLMALVSLVASIFYYFSLANIALKAAQKQPVTIADAIKPLSSVVGYVVTYIKIFISALVKLFEPPFVIPGIKYGIGSSLFLYENLDKNTENSKAVEYSLDITKGNILNMFALTVTTIIISIVLGLIPFSIGTIFTAPFSALCVAHTYLKLRK